MNWIAPEQWRVDWIWFACLMRSGWIVNIFFVRALGLFASTNGTVC